MKQQFQQQQPQSLRSSPSSAKSPTFLNDFSNQTKSSPQQQQQAPLLLLNYQNNVPYSAAASLPQTHLSHSIPVKEFFAPQSTKNASASRQTSEPMNDNSQQLKLLCSIQNSTSKKVFSKMVNNAHFQTGNNTNIEQKKSSSIDKRVDSTGNSKKQKPVIEIAKFDDLPQKIFTVSNQPLSIERKRVKSQSTAQTPQQIPRKQTVYDLNLIRSKKNAQDFNFSLFDHHSQCLISSKPQDKTINDKNVINFNQQSSNHSSPIKSKYKNESPAKGSASATEKSNSTSQFQSRDNSHNNINENLKKNQNHHSNFNDIRTTFGIPADLDSSNNIHNTTPQLFEANDNSNDLMMHQQIHTEQISLEQSKSKVLNGSISNKALDSKTLQNEDTQFIQNSVNNQVDSQDSSQKKINAQQLEKENVQLRLIVAEQEQVMEKMRDFYSAVNKNNQNGYSSNYSFNSRIENNNNNNLPFNGMNNHNLNNSIRVDTVPNRNENYSRIDTINGMNGRIDSIHNRIDTVTDRKQEYYTTNSINNKNVINSSHANSERFNDLNFNEGNKLQNQTTNFDSLSVSDQYKQNSNLFNEVRTLSEQKNRLESELIHSQNHFFEQQKLIRSLTDRIAELTQLKTKSQGTNLHSSEMEKVNPENPVIEKFSKGNQVEDIQDEFIRTTIRENENLKFALKDVNIQIVLWQERYANLELVHNNFLVEGTKKKSKTQKIFHLQERDFEENIKLKKRVEDLILFSQKQGKEAEELQQELQAKEIAFQNLRRQLSEQQELNIQSQSQRSQLKAQCEAQKEELFQVYKLLRERDSNTEVILKKVLYVYNAINYIFVLKQMGDNASKAYLKYQNQLILSSSSQNVEKELNPISKTNINDNNTPFESVSYKKYANSHLFLSAASSTQPNTAVYNTPSSIENKELNMQFQYQQQQQQQQYHQSQLNQIIPIIDNQNKAIFTFNSEPNKNLMSGKSEYQEYNFNQSNAGSYSVKNQIETPISPLTSDLGNSKQLYRSHTRAASSSDFDFLKTKKEDILPESNKAPRYQWK